MPLSVRVLRWYSRSGRRLPWRETRDPYAVLVSEVMLQQTQVARVIPAFGRFLRRFPTLAALASASLGDVLRIWSGLGYNRRARDLYRIARANPNGLPKTISHLDALPGVGAYTAAAVVCFSRRERVAFADTNIRRVLGRVLLGRVATAREAIALDEKHMPHRDADRWHHALMDIGALYCRNRAPRCTQCPLHLDCAASRVNESQAVAASPARRQQPFATSSRRVRGRILALATAGPVRAETLASRVGDARAGELAVQLVAEGLLVWRGDRYRLP